MGSSRDRVFEQIFKKVMEEIYELKLHELRINVNSSTLMNNSLQVYSKFLS